MEGSMMVKNLGGGEKEVRVRIGREAEGNNLKGTSMERRACHMGDSLSMEIIPLFINLLALFHHQGLTL